MPLVAQYSKIPRHSIHVKITDVSNQILCRLPAAIGRLGEERPRQVGTPNGGPESVHGPRQVSS